MRSIIHTLGCALAILACALPGYPKQVPVSPQEAAGWVRYTVPLPKSVAIPAKAILSPAEVAVVVPPGSDFLIGQARKELIEALRLGRRVKPRFSIRLQLAGPGSEALKGLANRDQAYLIRPEPNGAGLRLIALTPTGLYYAAKTLQQLVRPFAGKDRVEIPLATITDWPDMDARGLWGADCHEELKWMGERKLNTVEQISAGGVTGGKGWAKLKPGREPMVTEGPLYGVRAVPAILHLEQLSNRGIFEAFPNLRGKGGQPGCICYSQPQIVDLLADWIADLARLPHVSAVDVWMTENLHGQGGCRCEQCSKTDRNVLESRVIVAAWRKAEKQLGRPIQLYTLSSEETEQSNPQILAELPAGVRFWYYNWLTYRTTETPLVPSQVVKAAKGRWLGVVPNLDSMTHFCEPFTGADFIHYRMSEFVGKGLSGLLGYITPRVRFFRFNLEAAAEWSWNAKGRSPQEFALSWAVRQGIKDPRKWSEWAGLIGPVEWDIYGSEWPSGAQRSNPGPIGKALLTGSLPGLGTITYGAFPFPFGDIKSPEQLDRDLANASRALALSREMGIPQFHDESLVADGYMKSLKALYELNRLVKNGVVAERDRSEARRYVSMYQTGLQQAAEALPKWASRIGKAEGPQFVEKPVSVINDLRKEMSETAAKLGL